MTILIAAYAAAILVLTVAFIVIAADTNMTAGCDRLEEENDG